MFFLEMFLKEAVEPGYAVSEYARNVVALGEMEHQTVELFEPKASFRLSRNEPYTEPNSKRYLCWRRRRLPRRIYNTPRRFLLAVAISSLI